MEHYLYETLMDDQIRLIQLLPGEPDAPLRCEFQIHYLETPPQYEALSYTWGPTIHKSYEDVGLESCVGRSQETDMETALRNASASVGSLQSPDKFSDDLRFPEYSNAWPDLYFIFVGSTILVLQPNLEEALRHLRYADRSRPLWIDALCINQKDDLERAKQVSQMGRIFESAASVQIWLGGACDNSDDAFRFIETLPQLTAGLEPTQDYLHQEWIAFMARHAPYGYFTMTMVNQLEALSYLVNRDWFYRRWVVQEVAFAKAIVVQCGRCTVSWPDFAHTVKFLHNHHRELIYVLRTFHIHGDMFDWTSEHHKALDIRAQAASRFLFITNHLFRKHTKGGIIERLIKIDTLVTRLCDLETSEPRDTVFALISLSRDSSASNSLVPNYTKTSCEVFVDFVWYVISSSQSLDIILRPWAPRTVSVPSWILRTGASDQSRSMFQDNMLNGIHNHENHSKPLYAASGRSSPSCRIYRHASSYALETKGFIVTSVRQIRGGAAYGDVPISWGALAYREKFWSVLIGGKTSEGLPPPETWRAICETVFAQGKHYWQQGTHDTLVHLTELIDALNWSAHDDSRLSKAFLASFPQTEDLLPFLERLRTCTWNRRLVETSTGNCGLAPLNTHRRDLVCILMGCNLPVVLRPKGDLFTIVGAAYLHGMSDGEAMEDLREGKFALRDFVLV